MSVILNFFNFKVNINPGPAECNLYFSVNFDLQITADENYIIFVDSISSTLGLHPAITMSSAAAYTIKPPRPVKCMC